MGLSFSVVFHVIQRERALTELRAKQQQPLFWPVFCRCGAFDCNDCEGARKIGLWLPLKEIKVKGGRSCFDLAARSLAPWSDNWGVLNDCRQCVWWSRAD